WVILLTVSTVDVLVQACTAEERARVPALYNRLKRAAQPHPKPDPRPKAHPSPRADPNPKSNPAALAGPKADLHQLATSYNTHGIIGKYYTYPVTPYPYQGYTDLSLYVSGYNSLGHKSLDHSGLGHTGLINNIPGYTDLGYRGQGYNDWLYPAGYNNLGYSTQEHTGLDYARQGYQGPICPTGYTHSIHKRVAKPVAQPEADPSYGLATNQHKLLHSNGYAICIPAHSQGLGHTSHGLNYPTYAHGY
ncbi:unnamed protein product, partial [Meganyctiphanes norvegica]